MGDGLARRRTGYALAYLVVISARAPIDNPFPVHEAHSHSGIPVRGTTNVTRAVSASLVADLTSPERSRCLPGQAAPRSAKS